MNRSSSWLTVLPSLIIPTCMGLMMYLGMSAVLERDVINDETIVRYLTGHPVSTATLLLFFVGVGSLMMVAVNVFGQFAAANKIQLHGSPSEQPESAAPESVEPDNGPVVVDEMSDVDRSVDLGQQLINMPARYREHYLWRRLHDALHFIHRTGSSKGLEDETKYLSELDLDRQQQRYSLVRILIWATPMLGFLGTVLGISQALGGINVGPENDFQQMMGGLRSSLYVAFDTTALALVLSIVMMFGQFLVERFETQLLNLVDYRTRSELSLHFSMAVANDHEAVEKVGLALLSTTEELVQRQAELWQDSIQAAEQAWSDSITGVNEQVRDNLVLALDESVETLVCGIGQTIEKADNSMSHRWQQWQVTLSDGARNMKEHQRELAAQTHLIKEMVKTIASEVGIVGSTTTNDAEHLGGTNVSIETLSHDLDHEENQKPAPDSKSPSIVYSAFDESSPAESINRNLVPETVIDGEPERAGLGIFACDELPDPDSGVGTTPVNEGPQSLPRYRIAEQQAGSDPVVSFPIQVDLKKTA